MSKFVKCRFVGDYHYYGSRSLFISVPYPLFSSVPGRKGQLFTTLLLYDD